MEKEKRKIWTGLDVSKRSFIAAIDSIERFTPLDKLKIKEFPRTATGAESFLKWAHQNIGKEYELCVIMETTGCYSKELSQWFYAVEDELHVTIQNGRMISDFIKSLNCQKTDENDARGIARFGSDRSPAATRREAKAWLELRELERERTALIEARTALQNRNDSLFSASTRKYNGRAVEALTRQIGAIEKEIEKCIHGEKEMHDEVRIMCTMPGVGFISAAVLLGEFGSLKQYTSRQLSQLSGLTPRQFISGTSLNKSYMGRRGSKRARQILYLNSVSAVKQIPFLRDIYNRIGARGKTKMTARCACMRKMLLILRAMVASNCKYDPKILEKFTSLT